MDEVQEYLYNRPIDGKVLIDRKIKKALDDYYAEYGVKKRKDMFFTRRLRCPCKGRQSLVY